MSEQMRRAEVVDEPPDDLTALWREIDAALAGRTVFPGIPLTDAFAEWPGSDLGSWEAFVGVADAVGVQLLYAEATVVPPLPLPQSGAVRAATVDGHAGQTGRIELAFTHGGVLHLWQADASWSHLLDPDPSAGRAADELDGADGLGRGEWLDWRSPNGVERLKEALGADVLAAVIEHCATTAVGVTSIRGYSLELVLTDEKSGDPQLREWARATPDDPQYALKRAAERYVLDQVAQGITTLRREQAAAALSDLEALVADLGEFPGWREARLAAEKRRRIREFVTARLGFYDADVADRLYTAARAAPPSGQTVLRRDLPGIRSLRSHDPLGPLASK